MTSSQPVIPALATGTGNDVALSAPTSPEPEYLVGDFTGRGFDAATLTNTSSRSISIDVTTLRGATSHPRNYAWRGIRPRVCAASIRRSRISAVS